MADLTTASSAKEFEENLDKQLQALILLTTKLPQMHRSIETNSGNGYGSRYGRRETPGKDTFDVSFSVALATLVTVVRAIREAEDAVDTLLDEDGLEPDELALAQGELYAAKSMYLSLVKMFGELETSRLQSTAYNMSHGDFMTAIGRNKALPRFGEYARNIPDVKLDANDSKSSLYTYMASKYPPYNPF